MKVSVPSLMRSACALPRVSAYRVESVASTMARSVTGPAARVSLTTRVSTAGDAASATTASGPAARSGTPSHSSTQYTAKKVSADSSTLCTSTIGLWRNQRSGMRPPHSNKMSEMPNSSRNRPIPCSGQSTPLKPAKPATVPTSE